MFPGSDQLRREADKCVKCGLCTPHCPTYLLEQNENESPRGRIALMQGLASGQLSASPALHSHLQHCLTCRACENVCPAEVHFAAMLDHTRDVLRRRYPPDRRLRLGLWWVAHRRAWGGFVRLVRASRACGLLGGLQRTKILHRAGLSGLQRLVDLLPPAQRTRPTVNRIRTVKCGRVALFTGCMGEILDSAAVAAARQLLNRLGYEVVPYTQSCCGALHQHNGDTPTALQLAEENIARLEKLPVEAVLYVASGCGAQLSEYANLSWADTRAQRRALAFSQKIEDAGTFIQAALARHDIELAPLNLHVAVHEPCTQRNVLRNTSTTYALLRHIPGLSVSPMPDNAHCCGAAGSYLLTEAGRANTLRKKKIMLWSDAPTEMIVSNNAGCRIHLAGAVKVHAPAVEVLHPLELLARQLEPG